MNSSLLVIPALWASHQTYIQMRTQTHLFQNEAAIDLVVAGPSITQRETQVMGSLHPCINSTKQHCE